MSDDLSNFEHEATDDLTVMHDGEGLVIFGDAAAVDHFVTSAQLPSRQLDLGRLTDAASSAGAALQAASTVSAQSGRWMKLTEESFRAAQRLPKVKNSLTGLDHATLRASNGRFAKNLQFVGDAGGIGKAGALLTNPAVLAGVGGLMAQYAMQQTMDEITDYLAQIDAKIDDILRAQKDAVLADMIGIELLLDEAMAVRGQVGRVSEVTWSKVQGSAATIARTQAYAIRQLDALAEKLEKEKNIGELADLAKAAPATVVEWLAVLARSFQLQEGLGVLELDRVLGAAPNELDEHRIGLQTARARRRELIAETTSQLVMRMDLAASRANAKVLMNPISARVVVLASNEIASGVHELQTTLGLADDRQAIEARRWTTAAAEARDGAVDAGREGLQAVGRFGSDALENARMSTGRFAGRIANRLQRTDTPREVATSQLEDPEQ
ncbi:hypothetical protein [Microbacterium sp. nov. GSS16]|uniref:hypothetical protein n=1 Tax=Microbacterium sp. nov. GSS16 TaxID=3019890 RepID=UPI002304F8D5|nr:hypothetical protein [Microbacterium sp. nov. GSS16]WCD93278.1 hypothetical protein PGB26_03070 [Microbacterium sp. nov. GSS16]